MPYLFLSRIIYSFPFLLYICFNLQYLLTIPAIYPYIAIWSVLFLFSIFFYAISNRILPLLLIQFVFICESLIYILLSFDTGNYTFLLFIILSSFYTIEALRNDSFHLFMHILILTGGMYYIYKYYGITQSDFIFDTKNTLIIFSPIICRAIMSSLESKDILIKETIKNKEVFIPFENTEKTKKLEKKAEFWKGRVKDLKNHVTDMEKDKLNLNSEYQKTKHDFNVLYNKSQENQKINREIAHSYFALLDNIRFDLSHTFEENIHNILNVFMNITKATYVALITLDLSSEKDENGENLIELNLTDSVKKNGIIFSDDTFLDNEIVNNNIYDTINNAKCNFQSASSEIAGLEPIQHIIYVPIALKENVKGVLIQGFDTTYKDNIHNFNLSLMVAYHIFTAMQNENLYRQAKNDSYLDGLTQIYNKKYLLNNMQLIFNNIYNYESNLACIFVDVDYFKQYNDTYGHDKGDFVLKQITECLKKYIRRSDFLIRYGGDEFVILLSSVTDEKLIDFSLEVNQNLRLLNEKIKINGEDKYLSVSMGAKIFYPMTNNVHDANELLKLADRALYVSKNSGKGKLYILQD